MQYSLFFDGEAQPSSALMVREPSGAMRPAHRAEILSVARELVTGDELRGQQLGHPNTVKDFASFEKRVGNGVSEIVGQGRAQPGGANP